MQVSPAATVLPWLTMRLVVASPVRILQAADTCAQGSAGGDVYVLEAAEGRMPYLSAGGNSEYLRYRFGSGTSQAVMSYRQGRQDWGQGGKQLSEIQLGVYRRYWACKH